MQAAAPIAVGSIIAVRVYFTLRVSFHIVDIVVEQGQCISENSMKHIAVTHVQPLSASSSLRLSRLLYPSITPVEVYAIMIIGKTISFAGSPSINAIRITPSKPKSLPAGSRKPVQILSSDVPSMLTIASSNITSPAGAANAAERPKTNRVMSKIERTITLQNCGIRNGGS